MPEQTEKAAITEESLRQLLSQLGTHIANRDLPEIKKFIGRYVEKVIVYKEDVEVIFKVPVVDLPYGPRGIEPMSQLKHPIQELGILNLIYLFRQQSVNSTIFKPLFHTLTPSVLLPKPAPLQQSHTSVPSRTNNATASTCDE